MKCLQTDHLFFPAACSLLIDLLFIDNPVVPFFGKPGWIVLFCLLAVVCLAVIAWCHKRTRKQITGRCCGRYGVLSPEGEATSVLVEGHYVEQAEGELTSELQENIAMSINKGAKHHIITSFAPYVWGIGCTRFPWAKKLALRAEGQEHSRKETHDFNTRKACFYYTDQASISVQGILFLKGLSALT